MEYVFICLFSVKFIKINTLNPKQSYFLLCVNNKNITTYQVFDFYMKMFTI